MQKKIGTIKQLWRTANCLCHVAHGKVAHLTLKKKKKVNLSQVFN